MCGSLHTQGHSKKTMVPRRKKTASATKRTKTTRSMSVHTEHLDGRLPLIDGQNDDLKPIGQHGLEVAVARMPGWTLTADNKLSRGYGFETAKEATSFASILLRRAAKAGHPAMVLLNGTAVTAFVVPAGEKISRAGLKLARQFDLRPAPGAATAP
jgi:pterin-4a-carbinolamine dehydratase